MPVFATSDELKEVAIAFAEKVTRDADNAPPLVAIGLCLKWRIKDPELEFAIDLSRKPDTDQFFTYYIGDPERDPEVIFTMTGDAFHSFWLGKLSLPKALATRAVVIVKGNPVKILKLLPKIKGVFPLYRAALRETGHADLVKE